MSDGSKLKPPAHRIYALLGFMVFLWSLNFVIGKVALREIPSLLVAALRTFLSGLLILPVWWWQRRGKAPEANLVRDLPLLAVLSVGGIVANQVVFVIGLGRTSVAHTAIVIGLAPILVLALATLVGQEKLTGWKFAGMLIAFAGVATLQMARTGAGQATLLGDFFVFLSALFFALFSVFGKPFTREYSTLTVTAIGYCGGAIAVVPLLWWLGSGFNFRAVSAQAWLSVLYMAVFPSVVGYVIYYYALAHAPASRVSAFSFVQPFLATLLAVVFLDEPLTSPLLAGGALVLTGVYASGRG